MEWSLDKKKELDVSRSRWSRSRTSRTNRWLESSSSSSSGGYLSAPKNPLSTARTVRSTFPSLLALNHSLTSSASHPVASARRRSVSASGKRPPLPKTARRRATALDRALPRWRRNQRLTAAKERPVRAARARRVEAGQERRFWEKERSRTCTWSEVNQPLLPLEFLVTVPVVLAAVLSSDGVGILLPTLLLLFLSKWHRQGEEVWTQVKVALEVEDCCLGNLSLLLAW